MQVHSSEVKVAKGTVILILQTPDCCCNIFIYVLGNANCCIQINHKIRNKNKSDYSKDPNTLLCENCNG